MEGDFDEQAHLSLIAEELCSLGVRFPGLPCVAVYPQNMDEVCIFDGQSTHTMEDRLLHAKLIDALGGMLGRRWVVVDCKTYSATLEKIDVARRAIERINHGHHSQPLT